MKISKIAALVFGAMALAACSQPPEPPAYVERPWTGTVQPAPAAVQPASFVVNFASGSAKLSKDAKASVSSAAAAFKKGATTVSVVGYTDTVGKPKANERLSEARARSVRAALVKAGVPAGAITLAGKGETSLAVQTKDNTKEAANRRVVIEVK